MKASWRRSDNDANMDRRSSSFSAPLTLKEATQMVATINQLDERYLSKMGVSDFFGLSSEARPRIDILDGEISFRPRDEPSRPGTGRNSTMMKCVRNHQAHPTAHIGPKLQCEDKGQRRCCSSEGESHGLQVVHRKLH